MLRQYDSLLNEFIIPLIGNDKTTTSDQLEEAGVHFFGKSLVFPSDRLPKLNSRKKYAIINVDKHDQPGSHWIALAFDTLKRKRVLYNSLGESADSIMPQLGEVEENHRYDAEQSAKESDCGQRSLAWLLFLHIYGISAALKI